MTKYYDASKEFKPFANRGAGGQLIDEPSYGRHPRARKLQAAHRKENPKKHVGPNVRIRTGRDQTGYSYVRLRDGVIVGGVGRV